MLISIMIPTKNPVDWLRKALDSIRTTATNYNDIDIVLRMDIGDDERLRAIPELTKDYGTRIVVGKKLMHDNAHVMYWEMSAIAKGTWGWQFDDDFEIEGDWQGQLYNIPCDANKGPSVQPDTYALGTSRYHRADSPVGYICPIELFRSPKACHPMDNYLWGQTKELGWSRVYLNDVVLKHDGRARG